MIQASPIGKEKLTVSSSAVGFASIPANGAQGAIVTVEGGAIRYWADGSTPDATTGFPAMPGDQFALNGTLSSFKAIRRDASDATLQVQYYDGFLIPGRTAASTARVGLTASAPVAASVGTSSAQALAANASRTGLVAVNTSPNMISLAFGQTAVLNSGITLQPNGFYEMDDATFSFAVMNAIAAGPGSNLAIQEYT